MWHGTFCTTPHHLQEIGQVESFNQTLPGMLCTLPETQKSRWAEHLNHVVHAYNCTRHESTGYSPFFLLFGRHSHLHVDLVFGIEGQTNHENHSQYVEKWQKAGTEAYELAGRKSREAAQEQNIVMIGSYEVQCYNLATEFLYVI